ncbi:MAG: hypothetical protein EON58_14305, partial [Alphaproteobacteria bacterium]
PQSYQLSKDPLAKFHDGRGGRIQSRIIAELPHELSLEGMLYVMRSFSREFEQRNIPFNAALHAPDHGNDDRQWHFHLDYYDRPCRRLTAADFEEARVRGYINTTAQPGDWDFAALFSKPRHNSTRLFRQDKVKDVRKNDWIFSLRTRLSVDVNEALSREGHERRFDPRTYEKMGITAAPGQHLGTKRSAAEAKGNVDRISIRNERKQWSAISRQLDEEYNGRHRARFRFDIDHRRELEKANVGSALRAQIEAALEKLDQTWEILIETEVGGERARQLVERACSRANHVERVNDRWLEAHKAGKCDLSPAQRQEREALRSAAQSHLRGLSPLRDAGAEIITISAEACLAAYSQKAECERIVQDLIRDCVRREAELCREASQTTTQPSQIASRQEDPGDPATGTAEPPEGSQHFTIRVQKSSDAKKSIAPTRPAFEPHPADQKSTAAPVAGIAAVNGPAEEAARRMRVADRLKYEGLRIRCVGERIQFGDLAGRQLDVRSTDGTDKRFMYRLQRIARQQDVELSGLSAHARAYPDRVRLDRATGDFSLSPLSPKELVVLDRKWRGEPEYQRELKQVFEEHQKQDPTGGREYSVR